MASSASNPALPAETPVDPVAGPESVRFTTALRKGDEDAWATFFDRYRPRLLGYLARVWHGEASALDDLLQETLLRAVRHMRPFENEEFLWSWLTVLARSAVADHGRRRTRRWRFLRRWTLEAELRAIPADPGRFAAQIDAALARLDHRDRALLEAKYYQRKSVRALALEHATTEKTIEGRLARARRQLARILMRQNSP